MLKMDELREIIKMIDQSSIEEFVYENAGVKIELKKHANVPSVVSLPQSPPAPQVVAQPASTTETSAAIAEETVSSNSASENYHQITSPMVGTFYRASSPDTPPYVQVGSEVKEDTIVCIVEAMKLFNEIEAEIAGEIVEILVKDGELVEYGQPLFLVRPK